jgi:DNA-binding transcriptional MerR regulator
MSVKLLRLDQLVKDFSLYPRSMTDETTASQYTEHLLLGAEFPPIIVCSKTLRIIDGFTRHRAYEKAGRDKIECELVIVKDDSDFFQRAVQANAGHGRRYTPFDVRRIIQRSRELGLSVDSICGAVQISTAHFDEIVRGFASTSNKKELPLKATIRHMAGRVLTKQQVEVNRRLSGMNQSFYANQLIELIEAKLIDTDNGQLVERLARLNELLTEFFSKRSVAV